MKILLIASALLASSTAFAGTIVESEEFGIQGSVTNVAITGDTPTFGVNGLNEVLTIEGFDTSLGSLTGVQVNIFSQIDSLGESINNSLLVGETTFEFALTKDWTITSSVGSLTLQDTGVIFTDIDLNHEVGEVFDYDQISEFQSGSINVSDVSAFLNDVDFEFSVEVLNTFTNRIAGNGQFQNINNSASWGKVEVIYTFDDVVASVPETGSLAIFGLGLAGFALSRKAKKSA